MAKKNLILIVVAIVVVLVVAVGVGRKLFADSLSDHENAKEGTWAGFWHGRRS